MQGTIVKGIGGFYYIKTDNGVIECKARGKFRHNSLSPMVGDKVDIALEKEQGVINRIYSRKTKLKRPAVANVTQALVVFAFNRPEINEDLLNRFLISCELNNLKIVVCFNKLDLAEEKEKSDIANTMKKIGYDVIFLTAKENCGIDKIKEKLKGNITVLCGPSGVGKSTILNAISGKEIMETGEISQKLKRGKHTTRHSELIELEEGLIVDTPGFSSLDISDISEEKLQYCFPEFTDLIGKCKFTGCFHYKEPNCAIKASVEDGKIDRKRYEFYIKVLNEIISKKKY
ncbi:ribosome small subunit-dependent GTPase A [Clostridium ljungdahlii]|uniref:Small ribosomal subunit biogenesis GTPase RsgA n=1 Tax=Clostridium ljungdahlii (strain ATCC 55383 / DSM 13528 / PETC) TaxID=748727 RepID=D8GRX8_CLOLD|nr:ribosome small subunit-dependent GTPase A [Clostridium ljungdahlii]ADK14331.1 predicted GTPase [Clostridium ljungdahlii DSM 13528]OAA88248.1 putative ribosome biogenesis GTPase RsgA [Clostridium ljungdahlii DSM 13528]